MAAQWMVLRRLLYQISDIHMTRTEINVEKPEKPLIYRRFVDDIINKRKKKEQEFQ